MRGVYLVAAEIAARGLIVAPTSRSAAGADLLVTDENCDRALSVQVKTNSRPANFWLVGPRARSIASKSHLYVFVNIRPAGQAHEYYVVPSKCVAEKSKIEVRPSSTWYSFFRADAARFRSKWSLLGAASDE